MLVHMVTGVLHISPSEQCRGKERCLKFACWSVISVQSMIRKSVQRFSEKTMLNRRANAQW